MPTVGNTVTPTYGAFWYDLNTDNASWYIITMPVNGYITELHAYFDGELGSGQGYCCLWNGNTGALLATVNVGTVPQGSNSAGGQAWHGGALTTPLYVAGGTTLAIGFWMSQSVGFVTSVNSTGTSYVGVQASAPGTATGPASGYGSFGAYAVYSQFGTFIRRSGAWANRTVKLFRSGTWVNATRKIFRSGAWETI